MIHPCPLRKTQPDLEDDHNIAAWNKQVHAHDSLTALVGEMVEALEMIRNRAYSEYPVSIGNQNAWAAIASYTLEPIAKAKQALK